ncbi:hypothetical protein TTHERM_00497020 (macronuclear) [Tetrahymena thermophila SB210]|uniref:Uncharacterized protein n=1 Tax=Tetrahymena thermophila (strain SB210) TaxID=312017 RepID=I7MB48_TETTS|nr:hypothetical protein TTHERM_00497020 [Tetrahymena thermophila SB210]EAS07649.2 hypothetical protein TTHERM_00497020 [Tetrahymena thermophila SB210]|eukprot:XP_001027891.2 hypothetical protein TTHERM_00497020 [Tetrahymena thermophila SB210]
MINRNTSAGTNNQPKLTIQTDSSKIQQSNLKSNDANQKMKQAKANNLIINTPLMGNNSNLLGSQTVKNLRMNNLISPSSQMLTQNPFLNSQYRQSQQIDNSIQAQIMGQGQLGIQKNELFQLKKDSLQRPSTAAAAAAQLAGKSINRKQMVSITNNYQQYLMQISPDINQEKQDQMQLDNQLVEQDGERFKTKRPQTAFSNLKGISSSISSEFLQDIEQKMHFVQIYKDSLNSALQGIQTDDKAKIIEVEEPIKQEMKLEYGVYKLDMPQQVIELEKYGFKYFKIYIKNKNQPLFIQLSQIDSFKRNSLKIFLSTENQNPNIFNSNLIFENRYVIRFSEPSKTNYFNSQYLFVSFNTDTDLKLLLRIKFGTADFQMTKSPNIVRAQPDLQYSNSFAKKVKNEQKPPLQLMDDRTLQEEINEIMNRRKMKFLNCSQGLEYLKHNKKVLRINKDVKLQQELEKRFNNNMKILNVLENKRYQDSEKKETLVRKIDDQEKRRLLSQINRIGNQLDEVLKKFQTIWLQVFSLVSLAAKLKQIIHIETVKRAQISYVKMRKRRVIHALISFLKKSGENKFQRTLYQWKICSQLFTKAVQVKTKKKAQSIVVKFFLNFKELSILSSKLIELNLRVIKFQNKFSSFRRRKIKYKEEIKRYWSNQNDYLTQQVLYDMINSNKQTNNLNIENFLKSEMKKAQKSGGIKLDFKLQDEIVNMFIKERINSWRREFNQFKRANFQLFNLKKLIQQEKDNKENGKTGQQQIQKQQQNQLSPSESLADLFADPPKLFVKPNETQLKNMVKQYMAAKKQSAESQQQK